MTATQLRGLQQRLEERMTEESGQDAPTAPARLVRERVQQAMLDRPVAYIGGQDWGPDWAERR